ncbi:MAG: hypothetical protein ACPK7O_04390 [Methanobacterium sp.]
MEQRGQISIEFVLVIAFMLVIVLLIGSYIGEQSEVSTITAAARNGAMDAASNLALLNRNMEPIRINDVKMNGSGQNLTLKINVSSPISTNSNLTIFNATINSMAAQGYIIDAQNLTNQFDDVVVTGRHRYSVIIV